MKILFTSVGRRAELVQAFQNAGRRLNEPLMLYGADMNPFAPALSFCDRALIAPRIRHPDYIPFLLRTCREEQIDCLIPTIDTDLLLLAEHKNAFRQVGTTVLISDYDKIKICRDKRLTADYFLSLGLQTVKPISRLEQASARYPMFIKPLDGSASYHAYKVENERDLAYYTESIEGYILQPFVAGREYTVDLFCDFEGNPIYITPRERLEVRSGEVSKTRICQDDTMIAEMLRLIRDFRPCGQMAVQLIRQAETGLDYYIEMNPRFGGGSPLSMKAGADSAEAVIRLLRGERLSFCPYAAEDGAVFSRYDQSVRVDG